MNGVNDMAVGPGGFVPPNPGGGNNGNSGHSGGTGNGDAGMSPASRGLGQ